MFSRLWVAVKHRLNEIGASLVEYALLVALIAVVAIFAINAIGSNVTTNFDTIADCLENPDLPECNNE